MTTKQFKNLKRGDIVRHSNGHGESYVVEGNYGTHATLVRTCQMDNPAEWNLVFKARHKRVEE